MTTTEPTHEVTASNTSSTLLGVDRKGRPRIAVAYLADAVEHD